jgi:co-chaperonin GroES (HSP10)
MRTIRPAGERIALIPAKEEYEGKIALPESHQRQHLTANCIAVGDGKMVDGTQKKIYARPGASYLYQLDATQALISTFEVDGQHVVLLHQADLLCELHAKTITFDTISMVGHWLLIETYMPEKEGSRIVIPDAVKEHQHEMLHYRVAKKGPEAMTEADVGDEIYPARGRLTPLSIDGKIYCFLLDSFVYGFTPAVRLID